MTNKPIESFYAGNIEVAIWENRGEDSKIFHSVTAKRTYMDGNGEWKDAGMVHLLPQQIPDMILALSKSHEHLRMGMRQRRKQLATTGEGESNDAGKTSAQGAVDATPSESQTELASLSAGATDQSFTGRVGKQGRGNGR